MSAATSLSVSSATDKLYRMECHEQVTPATRYAPVLITRVPGGWIYTFYSQVDKPADERTSSVFVPFDNEFDQ